MSLDKDMMLAVERRIRAEERRKNPPRLDFQMIGNAFSLAFKMGFIMLSSMFIGKCVSDMCVPKYKNLIIMFYILLGAALTLCNTLNIMLAECENK